MDTKTDKTDKTNETDETDMINEEYDDYDDSKVEYFKIKKDMDSPIYTQKHIRNQFMNKYSNKIRDIQKK